MITISEVKLAGRKKQKRSKASNLFIVKTVDVKELKNSKLEREIRLFIAYGKVSGFFKKYKRSVFPR